MKPYSERSEWKDYLQLISQRPKDFAPSEIFTIVTDERDVNRFFEETRKMLGVIYKSEYHILLVDLIRSPEGRLYTYERILLTEDNAIVAMTVQDGKFVLLKQYRHSMRGIQYAFPRGFGENGISARDNVRKEVQEELGAQVHSICHLGNVIADSGLSGSAAQIYLCKVSHIQKNQWYEGIEDIILLSPEEIEREIAAGNITDGYTLAAYSFYKCKYHISEDPS